MLSTYLVKDHLLADISLGSPAAPPAVIVTASATAAPNTVQVVESLGTAPIDLTLAPGVAPGDQIVAIIRDLNGSLRILQSGGVAPAPAVVAGTYSAPLAEQLVLTYQWSGTSWTLIN